MVKSAIRIRFHTNPIRFHPYRWWRGQATGWRRTAGQISVGHPCQPQAQTSRITRTWGPCSNRVHSCSSYSFALCANAHELPSQCSGRSESSISLCFSPHTDEQCIIALANLYKTINIQDIDNLCIWICLEVWTLELRFRK